MKKSLVACFALVFMLVLVGCQSGPVQGEDAADKTGTDKVNEAAEPVESEDNLLDEPVTLTLWNKAMGIINDEVSAEMFAPVHEKYPNVTIEILEDVNIEDMMAAGKVPDLIATSNYYLLEHIDMGLAGNMAEFFETHGIALSQFNPAIVENLSTFAEMQGVPGAIYGMPVSMNQGVLAYNKDIFDQLGVPYPEQGMTWKEIIDLSRQVTGNFGGTDYIGFSPGSIQTMTRPQGLAVVDDDENVIINTPEYKAAFELLDELYKIPGVVNGEEYNYNMNFFMEERRLAMIPYWFAAFTSRIPIMEETGLNWGLTSFPTTPDNPNLGREVDYHLFVVPEMAKNREAALKVVSELITEEAQSYLGKEVLRLTVLDNEDVRNSYAEGSGLYEQEQLDQVFSVEPAPTPRPTMYDRDVYSILGEAHRKLAVEKQDINTVLREAEEEANNKVQELKNNQ
ncbi:ABC transporter substrate-binding protein [Bacillus niameyensis]|uniref:ABC transporter substrate-binding protein n=1 Tax=Bacillus niameyensis TaxID=1522308 RepID=UPI0007814410|nr:extracellular solute-binding protein [Bacillus niameyensis]